MGTSVSPWYMAAMGFLTTILTDEDFEHGILETLASRPALKDMPNRATMFLALFVHLDVDGNGYLVGRCRLTRGLHSSNFRLNVSAFCGTGGAFMGLFGGSLGGD